MIYTYFENPFKTMKRLKGTFKPLKCYFRFSTKNWYPILWVSKPSPIQIISRDVEWKDKDDTPRYECCPYIWIHLFGLNLIWYWGNKEIKCIDDYWEQALWYLYYFNTISYGLLPSPDVNKAKESWPWFDSNGINTWNDEYLIK